MTLFSDDKRLSSDDKHLSFDDRRKQKRHQLATRILIVDVGREAVLGRLVNIHQAGLLMLGRALTRRASHRITLQLPNQLHQQTHVHLGIECLWVQPAMTELALTAPTAEKPTIEEPSFEEASFAEPAMAEPSLHWSGCAIIDASSTAQACIQRLVDIYSSRD